MTNELHVEILAPDADDQRRAILTETLRQDLLALDVDSVTLASTGSAPDGSKGIDAATVGAILVVLTSSVELTKQVVAVARSWLSRGGPRNTGQVLKITMNGQSIELHAATVDQQQQLLDAFVAAAASPKPAP